MTPKLKKIIITVVVLGILFFAYNLFFGGQKEDKNVLISGSNGLGVTRNVAETQALGKQITQALVQIDSLNLDRSIFENSVFKTLMDRSESISPEPVGRKNPFAPLSDTSVNFTTDGSSLLNTESAINETDDTVTPAEGDMDTTGL